MAVDQKLLIEIAENVAYLKAKEEEREKIYMKKEECHIARKECKNNKKLDWRWKATFLVAAGGLLLAAAKFFI